MDDCSKLTDAARLGWVCGGALGMVAVIAKSELVLIIAGGVFVAEALSVIIQIGSIKLRGKRVFRMAPIHHHFEMKDWPETTIITRFWIIAAIGVALGLGIFYGDFLAVGQVGGS